MAQRPQRRLRSQGSCGKALRLPHEQSLLVGRDLAARYLRLWRQFALGCGNTRVQPCLHQSRLHVFGIFAEQEAILHQPVDASDDRTVVLTERGIALLDRRARIAGGDALRPRPSKRNVFTAGSCPLRADSRFALPHSARGPARATCRLERLPRR